MSLSFKIRKGFDFDEAIFLSKASRAAYDIFQYDDGTIDDSEIKSIYNTVNRYEPWTFVHSIRNDKTNVRGIILKQKIGHQYTVAFRGSIFTDRGYFELTDIIADLDWDFVSYGVMTNDRIKVAKGFYEGYESVGDEIRLFFKVILGRLTEKDVFYLKTLTPARQFGCITSMCEAGAIRLGEDFEKETQKLIHDAVFDQELGNDEELDKIIDQIKKKLLEIAPLNEIIDIYVTGHSLGGSLAFLSSVDLKRCFSTPDFSSIKVKVYTFGATKVGNDAFAEYYNQEIVKGLCYRVENSLDTVHTNPPPAPFPLSLVARNGLRIGSYVLGNFEHVGEPYGVTGLGSHRISLGFGSALEFFGGIPFPHSYETYTQLLQENQEWWSQLIEPIQNVLRPFFTDLLQEQIQEIERTFSVSLLANGQHSSPQTNLPPQPPSLAPKGESDSTQI